MILIIDNTAKQRTKMFLPKLTSYLESKNIDYKTIKGDASGMVDIIKLRPENIQCIILTGSPIMLNGKTDLDDYICNIYCLKHFTTKPIMGICFGCQIINTYFGGTLHDIGNVVCKQVNAYSSTDNSFKVKLCARYLPKRVSPQELDTLMYLKLDNKTYPALIKHKTRPIIGVMFHPEALVSTHHVLNEFIS